MALNLYLVSADVSQWNDFGILSHDQRLPVWIRDLQLDMAWKRAFL